MKVKTISRNEEAYTRSTVHDIYRMHRNYDPAQHPFERAREYTRALNATKMDKMFAKVCDLFLTKMDKISIKVGDLYLFHHRLMDGRKDSVYACAPKEMEESVE